jgi:hypothetical protein
LEATVVPPQPDAQPVSYPLPEPSRAYFRRDPFVSTLGKTKFLAKRLDVPLEHGARPYRTVVELDKWRNDLVHPQTVRATGTRRAGEYARNPKSVRPDVFARMKPDFVGLCFADVEAQADRLLQAATDQHRLELRDLGRIAFWGPAGSGTATLKR